MNAVLQVTREAPLPVPRTAEAPDGMPAPLWERLAAGPAWPAALVLLAYGASAFVVPTLANVAVTDDWVYYRTVETLLTQHQLRIHEMSSAALVFQAVWGAAFAAVFGLSFGVLRVSTLVMTAGGGLATYGLCRELGITREWSALGMAAYLFHPLALSLAFTFMTDPHFTALLMLASWLYVRGLRGPSVRVGSVLAASAVAACAVLVRQQGVLIPAGVVLALLLEPRRRLTVSRQGLILLLRVCAIPALTTLVYLLWLRFVTGIPWALSLFTDDFRVVGALGVAELVPRLAIIEVVYLGLFVLPLAVGVLPATARLLRQTHVPGRWLLVAWTAVAVVGSGAFVLQNGLLMPYAGQFIVVSGLGPDDVLAARPVLLDQVGRAVLTVVCVLAALVLGLALARGVGRFTGQAATGQRLVLGLAAGQLVGTFPPSVHFAVWDGTLDRYLLPLLPLGVVLMLSAVRGVRLSAWLAGAAVGVVGLVAVAGAHDYLSFLDGVWSLGHQANALGVANNHLDAGAGWDGLFAYQAPPSADHPPQTPHPVWWIDLFAPAIDSTYVVAGAALPDYTVVAQRTYTSWLDRQTLPLYLLRRPDVPGPP